MEMNLAVDSTAAPASVPSRIRTFLLTRGRERRVVVLLLGIIALSVADLVITITHLKTIGMIEANPIAAYLIAATQSTWILILYKLSTVGISVSLLYFARNYRVGEIATWSALAILVGMSVSWHNYSAYVGDIEQVRLVQNGTYSDSWLVLD